MTPDECVKVFSASPSQLPCAGGDRDKVWSRRVVVVVLTVMKPGRLSCKSMLKAVAGAMILFLLLSFAPLLHRGITSDTALERNPASSRRKLRLTANVSGRNLHVSKVRDSAVKVWNIRMYKSKEDIHPACQDKAILLIMITSSPSNRARRDAIRKTWCSQRAMGLADKRWQCVFMIGQTGKPTSDSRIKQEAIIHKDILRGSYLDVYRNLTLKVFHGFDWAVSNCHQVEYLLKTDDDCFVNTGLLHNFLVNHNHISSDLYVGYVFTTEEKRMVVRHPGSRWFVSTDDFASDVYPRYASGTGYLLSFDVLQRVVETSKSVPPFPVEDAYTGYLVDKLGIEPVASTRFTLYGEGWTTCNFLYLMVIHGVEANTQKIMLSKTLDASQYQCKVDESQSSWR